MRVEAVLGDITEQRVDVVVNAANAGLLGGGGVDGAIHRRGGPRILAACREARRDRYPDGLPTGDAVATTAGDLPARWVVHTVGPRAWEHPDGGADLLASCHRRVLEEAHALGAESVAFPAISCGVYGWDPVHAAPVAVAAVRDWERDHPDSTVTTVRFVLFDQTAYDAFLAATGAA
ncbi:MAG: O-acetyl-ADP-ribose deacetylase [Candidatus Nanopelagicales bacterium]